MSRRAPNAAAERAAQNQQTLKTLVKVESNKSCADCKKNKHPRWASWNLGIFVCIRCSGIHRGMGTHISRVKSVDLDAWTDEQLQNMLRWGNARANKYWEDKLAPGHVPAEAKIENFIRTKYESKRWVMDGGMPDPSTLDSAADDDIPLSAVQEKAKLERSASLRTSSAPTAPPPPKKKPDANIDLFGDDVGKSAPRTNTQTSVPAAHAALQAGTAKPAVVPPQRQQRTGGDSLLGFDFFGGTQSGVPPRPSSAAASISSSTGPSRPDLKQSILSLYASTPRTQTPATQPSAPQSSTHTRQTSNQTSSLGGISNDFSTLNFSPPQQTQPPPITSSTFSSLTSPTSSIKSPPSTALSGGGFFDPKPSKPAQSTSMTTSTAAPDRLRGMSTSSGFGDSGFGDFESGGFAVPAVAAGPGPTAGKTTSNGLDDLFGFSAPAPPTTSKTTSISQDMSSPFNLSASKPAISTAKPTPSIPSSTIPNMDPWGSNDPWASPDPAPTTTVASAANRKPSTFTASKAPPMPATLTSPADDWGFDDSSGGGFSTAAPAASSRPAPPPRMATDDDFGGWESSAVKSPVVERSKPVPSMTTSSASSSKPAFAPANDADLFSNVWE